jgi:hypothetical protein
MLPLQGLVSISYNPRIEQTPRTPFVPTILLSSVIKVEDESSIEVIRNYLM